MLTFSVLNLKNFVTCAFALHVAVMSNRMEGKSLFTPFRSYKIMDHDHEFEWLRVYILDVFNPF